MGVIISDTITDRMQDFTINAQNPQRIQNEATYHHCVKADALRIKNYFWESIDEYLLAISHDDSNVDAFKGLGLSYRQVGYIRSAIETFEKARKITPFDKVIYFELGCSYSQDNNYSRAAKEFRRAIKIDPHYVDAQFHLAIAHELNNELDLALKIYNKIIEERPSFIAAYNNLGSLYMRLGLISESIRVFRKLLEINPDYSRAYLGIAVAYDKLGQRSNSIRYYKKYVYIKPNSANISYIKERINALRSEKRSVNNANLKLIIHNI